MIDKQRIRQSFQRAAQTYEDQAVIQQRVADHLLTLLQDCCPGQTAFGKVLEIGCCTGLLTGKLTRRFPEIGELVLNDLVEEFALRAGDQPGIAAIRFLGGDIETLDLPGPFDLIISSSTFHWIGDLPRLLARLSGQLSPGGILTFSLYGPDNLKEIRQLTGIGLDYHNLEQVRAMAAQHCCIDACDQRHERFYFQSPAQVLEHLRQTGVNALGAGAWTPRRLARFNREYREQFSGPEGLRLTYHPLFLVGHRPQVP